jgi:signal transduction histidine kinase
MAVLCEAFLSYISLSIQMTLLYFCLQFLFQGFLYRQTIKILLFGMFSILRITAVFWISSIIHLWLFLFFSLFVFLSYYKGSLLRKYLVAAAYSSIVVMSAGVPSTFMMKTTYSMIWINLIMQICLLGLVLIRYRQNTSHFHEINYFQPIGHQFATAQEFAVEDQLFGTGEFLDGWQNDHMDQLSDVHQQSLLTAATEQLRILRHDRKHHIATLLDLAEKGQIDSLIHYLQSIETEIYESINYVSSNNPVLDSTVNYMITKALAKGCFINAEVILPEKLELPFYAINIILRNLLENAIEAAVVSQEKRITVTINFHKGVLYLDISNTYKKKLIWYNGKLITRKMDKKYHGIGMQSVEAMVKKCKGIMEIQHDDHIFRVLILLYLTK